MPGIKDDREDSDGEEMEHESGESDKSSSTCESSDAPSDSDDSSEMDEEECERRRAECMENLVDMERQFTVLREQHGVIGKVIPKRSIANNECTLKALEVHLQPSYLTTDEVEGDVMLPVPPFGNSVPVEELPLEEIPSTVEQPIPMPRKRRLLMTGLVDVKTKRIDIDAKRLVVGAFSERCWRKIRNTLQLYRERVTQVETKLGEVRSGRAQEYIQPLEELDDNMRIRLEVSGILRELRLTNIRNQFEAEELASRQNYESEKCLLWDSMNGDLEDKIRRLEEDRNNVDISADLWLVEQNYGGKMMRRGKTDLLNPLRRKPVSVSGPYIVYMLSDTDILEDWTVIKKAMSVSKRKSDCKFI